ncbi:MAG: PIN domain-containing protein [Terriglobales bacterium]
MTTWVLDASAILRYTDQEPGYKRVRELFKQAAKGDAELLLSAVNWGEIVGALYKRVGMMRARTIAGNLAALPMTVVPVGAGDAETAAIFTCDFKVPYADAFAGALTLAHSTPKQQATLMTADYDFKAIPAGTIKIEFLPPKAVV